MEPSITGPAQQASGSRGFKLTNSARKGHFGFFSNNKFTAIKKQQNYFVIVYQLCNDQLLRIRRPGQAQVANDGGKKNTIVATVVVTGEKRRRQAFQFGNYNSSMRIDRHQQQRLTNLRFLAAL